MFAGDYAKALSILETFNKKYPGYATVQIRIIGVHRRRAEMEKSVLPQSSMKTMGGT